MKLNSSEWCNIVFEGKNKNYGAYYLRQTSSKRHLLAFGIIFCCIVVISAILSFLNAVNSNNTASRGSDEVFELSNISNVEEKIPETNIIRQEMASPLPLLKSTIQFMPPVITEDNNVNEDKDIKSIEELKSTQVQISTATVDGSGDKKAMDIEDFNKNKVIVAEPQEDEKPFIHVEQNPLFPGGDIELMRYISRNLKYPTIAAENGIEGRVVVRFVVTKEGNISEVQVIRTLDSSCDKEAIRVVKSMPRWVPGMQNGRKVAVYYTLPILFKLQN